MGNDGSVQCDGDERGARSVDGTDCVEAECTVCRWKFFQSHADELSGLSGEPMGEIIDRQATAHELATDHKVRFVEGDQ